jgi:hypothetical protein
MITKRWARSLMVIAVSCPEPMPAEEGMMEEPGKSDTKLSRVGD